MELTLTQKLKRWIALKIEPSLIRVKMYLEQTGRWNKAQRLRCCQGRWQVAHDKKTKEAVPSMLENDMRQQEIIQREAFLLEECQRVDRRVLLTKDDQKQLEEWQKERYTLNQELWRAEREGYMLWQRMPKSPYQRGMATKRKHPEWYMMKSLRLDCAGRGGCCGRDCRCCERPRGTIRLKAFGHCTA
ncbi:uncharacterized protein BO80DRAFT_457952 [Aspergillus ibericus CBS 121593]|uniref:Uncharacterized protein n=1 Tax=Aspergillus ibericus CBS 121593 TaxID=1448316 RepID=A0A395GQA9_9EURO|nr:hypothetical protein BO80DRAFT_457952 [Aspergillus ibericus CBS 121593]RAK97700.1 hypothetical protein BO80DRAFT_457952 [Aspergillus ibericus CBS 121593]